MIGDRRDYPQMRAYAVQVMARRACADAPSEHVAAVVAAAAEQICARFATIVGDSGISAILDRSGKERAIDLGAVRRWPEQVAQVREQLAALNAPAVRDAGIALLSTFLGMVCTFIGEPLTLRLLHDVWPETLERPEEPT